MATRIIPQSVKAPGSKEGGAFGRFGQQPPPAGPSSLLGLRNNAPGLIILWTAGIGRNKFTGGSFKKGVGIMDSKDLYIAWLEEAGRALREKEAAAERCLGAADYACKYKDFMING